MSASSLYENMPEGVFLQYSDLWHQYCRVLYVAVLMGITAENDGKGRQHPLLNPRDDEDVGEYIQSIFDNPRYRERGGVRNVIRDLGGLSNTTFAGVTSAELEEALQTCEQITGFLFNESSFPRLIYYAQDELVRIFQPNFRKAKLRECFNGLRPGVTMNKIMFVKPGWSIVDIDYHD